MSSHSKHAPRVPIGVRGGIRAQSGRGLYGRPWWSRRWLDVIEGFRLGARLGRGRCYALSGQVAHLEIGPGCVTATVQGSNPAPYRAEIRLHQLDDAGRQQVLENICARPVLAAQLLVRNLPREIEAIFQKAHCPLFPERAHDITTTCTCPDWANPCKHLAAVYFLLGEALDRDPFMLLTLRGLQRQDLITYKTVGGVGKMPVTIGKKRNVKVAVSKHAVDLRSPTTNRRSFWGDDLTPFEDYGPALKNAGSAPLICRLGALPFWRGQERFLNAMIVVYNHAAPLGWSVWTGEASTFRRIETALSSDSSAGPLRRQRLQMDVLLR